MPEEIETPHPDYVKGFNEGYLISKQLPDLAAKMPKDLAGERGQGFVHGTEQAQLELRQEKYPAWRRTDWLEKSNDYTSPDKTKDLGIDMDGPEPEMD